LPFITNVVSSNVGLYSTTDVISLYFNFPGLSFPFTLLPPSSSLYCASPLLNPFHCFEPSIISKRGIFSLVFSLVYVCRHIAIFVSVLGGICSRSQSHWHVVFSCIFVYPLCFIHFIVSFTDFDNILCGLRLLLTLPFRFRYGRNWFLAPRVPTIYVICASRLHYST